MLHALIYAAAYCLDGIILLALGFVVHDALTPGALGRRIYEDRSMNAALVVSAQFLSLGAIMFTCIWVNGDGWHGSSWTLAFGVLGIVLQAITFLLLDVLTPGSLREIAVHEAFHPGALVAAAAMLAVGAIVCASIA